MTQVISISQAEGHTAFGSPLRRSSSQSSFLLQHPPSYPRHSPYFGPRESTFGYDARLPTSEPSSAPSSPRFIQPEFSRQPSYISTASSLSLNDNACDEDDSYFPIYDDCLDESQDVEPPASPNVPEPTTASQPPLYTSALSRSHLFDPNQTTGDDMAIRNEPSRHVDYLSHTWKEEDIWASWRHVAARKHLYSNGPRLENASWRTWAKSKYRLNTTSPETLNWMKDHDVTWLYGPLQPGNSNLDPDSTPPASQMSRSNSFGMKKPILKKRSMSEIMLQRSLSSSTLMKQATDALSAQQFEKGTGDRTALGDRKVSDFISLSGSETPVTRATTHAASPDLFSSTSGSQTPCTQRHIHFNDKVEQCIAINCDGEDHMHHVQVFQDETESSEDDVLTMQPVNASKVKSRKPGTPRNSFSNESKTIAMLPSTTLNYRGDTPDIETQQAKNQQQPWGISRGLNPSTSQRMLRPSTASAKFLLDEEDDDSDMNWQPSAGRRDSVFPAGGFRLREDDDEENDDEERPENLGLRRTPSGMFMPYDEDDDYPRDGLLGKVVDTVNTARDIAHVIWNVGWRGN